jgi:hypothetical protein
MVHVSSDAVNKMKEVTRPTMRLEVGTLRLSGEKVRNWVPDCSGELGAGPYIKHSISVTIFGRMRESFGIFDRAEAGAGAPRLGQGSRRPRRLSHERILVLKTVDTVHLKVTTVPELPSIPAGTVGELREAPLSPKKALVPASSQTVGYGRTAGCKLDQTRGYMCICRRPFHR